MATEMEKSVLEFYQVPSLLPEEWPAEKNNSDVSEDEDDDKKRRKSRYQALELAVTNRNSMVPGSETSGSGVTNLVQRDEPDPLGTSDSVVRTLRQLGVPVQDEMRLRNRFLLSSTTFSPALFLSQVHATADTQSLLDGLDVLSQSIDQKSASLKVLVESNFERFVRAKATIDNVYKEMKYRGMDPNPPRTRAHSRHASRTSFRNSGAGGMGLASPVSPAANDPRKKNALTKESEYGVLGMKTPLLDVSAKAEEVWGPALGGREKEEVLKTVSASLERYREYVETSASIADSIKRKDHESLVEEYTKARKFAGEAKRLAQQLGTGQPSESQLHEMLIAGRMWHDVAEQMVAFKRDVWNRLLSPQMASKVDKSQDQPLELIALLLELGVEENPIWMWLISRYDYLKRKIHVTAERLKVEVEVLRRRLANADKPPTPTIASHIRCIGRPCMEGKPAALDAADIVELWEKMLAYTSSLLSSHGILGELVEFWTTVQGFLDGNTQLNLPGGYHGESRGHHVLSPKCAGDLQKGLIELVDMVREHVLMFLAEAPPEDLSLLLSPSPQSPSTPATPLASMSGALSPSAARDPRFHFDANNPPPPSPRKGETWEKFAFWPPWSNSISGVHYLSKMLALVGSGAADMASLAPVVLGDAGQVERLKTLVGSCRDRCVAALCAAWNRDAENMKYVEDWKRMPDRQDVTCMPVSFASFEGALLTGMQKILYISDAMSNAGAGEIVLPPPAKLLHMVRSQYVTTLYKAFSGMVENAERSPHKEDDEWVIDADGPPHTSRRASLTVGGAVNPRDRNVRMLLTLSNLQSLRSDVVPALNTQFENAFSVKLTDETKTIRDVLSQIDARLFTSYTRPAVERLCRTIQAGVAAPDWEPEAGDKPREVKPYIYETLLGLVLVHTQVSTTAASLTGHVIAYLLEQASAALLEAFRARRTRYSLGAVMQATLDVEFVAQTLHTYTSDRAVELQGQIYQELDARTDNDARAKVQTELPEMRNVLKRLREASRSEFACFKRLKPPQPGGSAEFNGSLQRADTEESVGSGR